MSCARWILVVLVLLSSWQSGRAEVNKAEGWCRNGCPGREGESGLADGRTAEGIGPPCAVSTDRCHGMVKA
jgi:hypothetical protein